MASARFLDRLLSKGGPSHFAAIAGPNGAHVVEYVRGRDGLALQAGIRHSGPVDDVGALADSLAEAVEALGGRRGELAVALSGFGSAHHILTLPEAEREILRPIVRRELLRYYPDLDDPIIDFVVGGTAEGKGERSREILVGAVPRGVGIELARSLRERDIVLRHLTVLPQALQAVYDAFDGGDPPAVMVLVMETGTLIGCFHQGSLRLFIEPPQDVHGRAVRDPEAVTEQVERANLFLRQQFPSARIGRVLLAAPAGEYEALETALERELQAEVGRLAEVPSGSLAALGAALSTDEARAFQLLPREVRPRTRSERLTRRVALGAAALVTAAAIWWAGSAIGVARESAGEAQAVERQVSTVLPALNRTRSLLDERRDHKLRLEFLDEAAAGRTEVRRIMEAVSAAVGPLVTLQQLTIRRAEESWTVDLAGRARAGGSAAAVRAIDALYRGVQADLPVIEAEFGELMGVDDHEAAPVAIGFDMSFIVKWQTDLER